MRVLYFLFSLALFISFKGSSYSAYTGRDRFFLNAKRCVTLKTGNHILDLGIPTTISQYDWARSLQLLRNSVDLICREPSLLQEDALHERADPDSTSDISKKSEFATFGDPKISAAVKECMLNARLIVVIASMGPCFGLNWPTIEHYYDMAEFRNLHFGVDFEMLRVKLLQHPTYSRLVPNLIPCYEPCMYIARIFGAYLKNAGIPFDFNQSACRNLPKSNDASNKNNACFKRYEGFYKRGMNY